MQPEPADHRLRPTSTVKGQCESIVPLHFQVFSAASSPRRTALRMDDKKARLPAGKRTFSSVQFWDYCRFAQNLPAVFTLKPCSDAQTASSTRERNLSFLSVCLT